jgi:hypothetical protein
MAETIKTSADKFLDILKRKNKKVNVEEIADELKLPLEQVEEWADVLEEHDLIDVQYSPLKGMAIKPRIHEMKQEELKQKVKEIKPKLRPKITLPRITLPSLRRRKIKKRHEVIRGKFMHASELMAQMPRTLEVKHLKKEKTQLQKELKDLQRHVSEIHKAPAKEVKKKRFVKYVAKTEKKAKEIEKRTDMFTRKIRELENTMERHKERRH